MSEEMQLLIQAIESLKQESDLVKDYIFPVVSAFLGALFGGLVAYFMYIRQEKVQLERTKIDAVNKWTLAAEDAFGTLLSMKNNYHGELTDNPIQRATKIPTILLLADPITTSIPDLYFLVPKDGGANAKYPKWSQLSRIRSLKANFNLLITYWKKRNEIDRPIKEKVVKKFSEFGFANVGIDQLIDCVGGADLTSLIDLTEQTIKLTDDILIELNSFLHDFPIFAKEKVKEDLVKSYGTIMRYSAKENPHIQRLLKRSPVPDFRPIENLFGSTAEAISKRYETGYEKEL